MRSDLLHASSQDTVRDCFAKVMPIYRATFSISFYYYRIEFTTCFLFSSDLINYHVNITTILLLIMGSL